MEGKLNTLLAVLLILMKFGANAEPSSSDLSGSRPDLSGHRNCERVKCESWQYKYSECPVRPSIVISRVTVRDKISHSACLFSDGKPPNGDDTNGEGIYGFHENTVWVHRGCRAVFDVCLSGQSGTCRQVKCESWNFQYAECKVDEHREITEVTVYDKLSVSECANQEGNIAPEGYRKGQIGIYGYSGNTLWVHRGCRAWFDVCFSDGTCNLDCKNGGKCTTDGYQQKCVCPHGYNGSLCEAKQKNCEQVKCESWNYQYNECSVKPSSKISTITVHDKVSRSACLFSDGKPPNVDDTEGDGLYGFHGNTLWVHRGCRAMFDVCFSDEDEDTVDDTCNLDCKNGGRCTTDGYQQRCVCPHSYTGSLCEADLPAERRHCERVKCESWQFKYEECPVRLASQIDSVTVREKMSISACRNVGRNPPNEDKKDGIYGFYGNTLWVHRGCRGLFDVCFSGKPAIEATKDTSGEGESGTCRQIKCESWNYEYAECNAFEHMEIEEVTVDDRVSVSKCVHKEGNIAPDGYLKGQTGIYGYSGDTLWVHRGCRAWFKVCFSDAEVPENLPLESVASLHRNVKLIIIVAPIIGFVISIAIVLAIVYWYRHQSSHLTNPPRANRPLQYENNLYATVDSLTAIIPEKNVAVSPEKLPEYSPDLKNGEYTYTAPPAYQEKGAV